MYVSDIQRGAISPKRLRIGMIFIIIWWLPIWLLSPLISWLLGDSGDVSASHAVFVVIIAIQTIFGLLGMFIVGRTLVALMKQLPRRQVPKVMWRVLISGKIDDSLMLNKK